MLILIKILDLFGWAVFYVAVGLTALLILRVVIAWASYNYYSWVQFNLRRVTEPIVRPFRSGFGGAGARHDLIPLWAAVMILMTGLFAAGMIWELASILNDLFRTLYYGSLAVGFLLSIIVRLAGWLYVVALLLRFGLPWLGVGYRSALLRFIYSITEPLLRPLRKYLVIGMMDLSIIAAIIIVQIATSILVRLVISIGS